MMQMKVQSYVENLIPVEAAILKSSQNATSANSHRVNVVPAFGVCSFSFFLRNSILSYQPHSARPVCVEGGEEFESLFALGDG